MERHEGSDAPIATMPHLEHTGVELDGIHPSLIPPDDEDMEDTHRTMPTTVCSAMGSSSPSVPGKTQRATVGSGGQTTRTRQQSAA